MPQAWRRALALLLLAPLAATGAAGGGASTSVAVVLQVETASVDMASSTTGAEVSFEVDGAWLDYEVLCERTALGEEVEAVRSLASWPTRARLRARGDAFADEWGLRRIYLTHQGTGRIMTLLPACDGADCAMSAASLHRWVRRGSESIFLVPSLDSPEWQVGSWGACCCPTSDPLLSTCAPGQRTRDIWCPEASCSQSPQPPASEACEDHAECPYEPMCPLGRGVSKMDCDSQAWLGLAVALLLVVLGSCAVRFCYVNWFKGCCPKPAGPRVVSPTGDGDEANAPSGADQVASGLKPDAMQPEPEASEDGGRPREPPPQLQAQVEQMKKNPGGWQMVWQHGHGIVSLDEDSLMVGRWRIAAGAGENLYYNISKLPSGRLQLHGNVSTGQRVTGSLERRGQWLISLVRSVDVHEEDIGIVRMRYLRLEQAILSNFQIPGDNLWGPDYRAYKAETKLNGDWDNSSKSSRATKPSKAPSGPSHVANPRTSQDAQRHELLEDCYVELKRRGDVAHGQGDQALRCSGVNSGGPLCVALGCMSGAPEGICGEERHSMVLDAAQPAPRLLVQSPNKQRSCSGEYVLLPGERPNGFPAWEKTTGNRWIYTGTDGKWYIGGQGSRAKNFACSSGFIFRDFRHYGLMPESVGEPWEYGDGSAWHVDAGIRVAAPADSLPGLKDLGDEDLVNLEVADMSPWWPKVDSPGRYVVVHANSAVTAAVATAPPVIARLAAGTVVRVKEVVYRTEDMRVRGRIESPVDGWISIRDLEDGYQWVRKHEEDDLSTEEGGGSGRSRTLKALPSPAQGSLSALSPSTAAS